MKLNKKNDIDIDFIGSQEPLTSSEEMLLKNYFEKKRESNKVIKRNYITKGKLKGIQIVAKY